MTNLTEFYLKNARENRHFTHTGELPIEEQYPFVSDTSRSCLNCCCCVSACKPHSSRRHPCWQYRPFKSCGMCVHKRYCQRYMYYELHADAEGQTIGVIDNKVVWKCTNFEDKSETRRKNK